MQRCGRVQSLLCEVCGTHSIQSDTGAEQYSGAGLRGGPLRRNISMDEVAQHRTQEDAWLVHNGKVLLGLATLRSHIRATGLEAI